MPDQKHNPFGETLYQALPSIYRERDASGDLRGYLEGCADLLDAIQTTLWQKQADNFADNPLPGETGAACQDWLLPYFAELLDTRLVSPLPDGQREEIANAIRWRQGKGTLAVIEAVVEAIAQTEAVIHEGWLRVATTPRLNSPLLPARSLGYAREPEPMNPGNMARHPGLVAATVDLRCPSRALAADASTPGAQAITVAGVRRVWRQGSVHGAPCFPDSYEDVSVRTVDLRTPNWQVGRHHPRRLQIYLPPPSGWFAPGLTTVDWSDPPSERFDRHIEIRREQDDRGRPLTVFRNRSLDSGNFQPLRIRRRIELGEPEGHDGPPDTAIWRFEGLVLDSTLKVYDGRLELMQCAARVVISHSIDRDTPNITARDCLIGRLQNARGRSQLEYCSVLNECLTETLDASDSLFTGVIRKDHDSGEPPATGCLRFCGLRADQNSGGMHGYRVTRRAPVFFEHRFGRRYCGVLHPASGDVLLAGSEDEGEIGAFHHRRHALLQRAVIDKLADYLPLGQEAVLIQDPRLHQEPRT